MRAIILAAGRGKRLGELTHHRPKCLIPIGGTPLLSRTLSALDSVGIKQAVLVVGHQHEAITKEFGKTYKGLALEYVVNPNYQRGSILSLWSARAFFDDDILIMDADVLFPKQFLSLLIRSPHPNLMLLDQTSESQGEEQMLLIKKGRIVESTKRVQGEYDLLGEGVGFLKLSASAAPCLKRLLQDFIDKEQIDLEYEDVFKFLFQEVDVCYEPVGGLPWTEIDFPEDIRRAEEIILPRLMEYEREIC